MLVKFPNGAVKETGGPVGANLLVPNFTTSTISYGDYSGGNVLYTAATVTELALFIGQIYEALRRGDPLLVLDSQVAASLTLATPTPSTHNGGVLLLVNGTGFRNGGSMTIGGFPVISYQYIAHDNLLVVTPPGTNGAATVTYTDSRGSVSNAGIFTYN